MALPKVLANFTTSLATKISSTASSLTLSRSTDPDGTTLSGQYILTIDEGASVEEHLLVTLAGSAGTIDTRGLSKVDMTTSKAANKFAHDRGAETKITNAVLIKTVNRLNGTEAFDSVALTGVASITGLTTPTSGETTKAANVAYVNAVSVAGAADATTSVKGIVELATASELAAGTATGSTGANLVAASTNFNATPSATTLVPVTNASGKLAAGFGGAASTLATLNASSLVVEDPANATTTPTASKIVKADATSKISDGWIGLTTAGDTVYSDGTDLQRLAIGTAGQILKVNSGATAPSWLNQKQTVFTTAVTVSNTLTETNLLSVSIPGGTLLSTGVLKGYILFSQIKLSNTKRITFKLKYGATTVVDTGTLPNNYGFNATLEGRLDFILAGSGATNTQKGVLSYTGSYGDYIVGSTSGTDIIQGRAFSTGTAAEDSTAAKTFSITVTFNNASASDAVTADIGFLEVIN